jgi:hypothetical protein
MFEIANFSLMLFLTFDFFTFQDYVIPVGTYQYCDTIRLTTKIQI